MQSYFSQMSRLCVLYYFSLCLLVTCFSITGYSQSGDETYFLRLDKIKTELPPDKFIDSVIAMPYDIMVGNLNRSKEFLSYSKNLSTAKPPDENTAELYGKLGIVHYLMGSYDSSTYYNLEAVRIFEETGHKNKAAGVLCLHGYQIKRRDLSEAFRLFRKGFAELEKSGTPHELTSAYDNFGVLFEMREDADSAELFYSKALELKKTLNDSIGIPYSLNNLALIKMIKKDFAAAKELFDQAYALRVLRNDEFGIIENLTFYGDYFSAISNWKEAIRYYLQSNLLSEKLNYPRQQQYNSDQLSLCYEKAGMPREALAAARESGRLKDLLQREANNKTVLELEQRFKTAEKDRSIAQLEKTSAERKLYMLLIAAALIVVAFSSLIFLQWNRRKADAAKNLAILAEREAGLIAVFDATENERKRIARDLHDGIGQQLSGLKLGWENLISKLSNKEEKELQQLNKLNSVLDEACNDLRNISHRMMPKALQERGLLSALEELAQKSLGISGIIYSLEHFNVAGERFDERVELGVYRICQELISNILRHSKANDVTIQLYKSNRHLILIVEDNGIGIQNTDGEGTGMRNMMTRIHTIGGEIIREDGPERGTVVTLKVPVKSS